MFKTGGRYSCKYIDLIPFVDSYTIKDHVFELILFLLSQKFLDKILGDNIRLQDKSSAYFSAYNGNLENVDYVFEYVTKNHEKWSKV